MTAQYIVNSIGERVSVVLPIAEYEALLNSTPDDDDDAYWAAEATAVLDRIERGEERVITLEQWETRHGLGG